MGVKAFEPFFYAIGGNLYIRHFGVSARFEGGVSARFMLGFWDGKGRGFTRILQVLHVLLYKLLDIGYQYCNSTRILF